MLGGGFPSAKQTISEPVWLTHTLLVAIGKPKLQVEESSHMTLAHTSRSSFHLSPAQRCSGAASGSALESGAGLTRRLTFQSQLGSVLGKVLDVYIFSHFQSSLQHCEMNVIIPTSLISKLSLREVNSFSQGHSLSAWFCSHGVSSRSSCLIPY